MTTSGPITTFGPEHGAIIKAEGTPMRKASVTWVWGPIQHAFNVSTNEGPLTAHKGDYVAYDETSGHVWPVAASYVEANYERVES